LNQEQEMDFTYEKKKRLSSEGGRVNQRAEGQGVRAS
jgi:hypothetical protein